MAPTLAGGMPDELGGGGGRAPTEWGPEFGQIVKEAAMKMGISEGEALPYVLTAMKNIVQSPDALDQMTKVAVAGMNTNAKVETQQLSNEMTREKLSADYQRLAATQAHELEMASKLREFTKEYYFPQAIRLLQQQGYNTESLAGVNNKATLDKFIAESKAKMESAAQTHQQQMEFLQAKTDAGMKVSEKEFQNEYSRTMDSIKAKSDAKIAEGMEGTTQRIRLMNEQARLSGQYSAAVKPIIESISQVTNSFQKYSPDMEAPLQSLRALGDAGIAQADAIRKTIEENILLHGHDVANAVEKQMQAIGKTLSPEDKAAIADSVKVTKMSGRDVDAGKLIEESAAPRLRAAEQELHRDEVTAALNEHGVSPDNPKVHKFFQLPAGATSADKAGLVQRASEAAKVLAAEEAAKASAARSASRWKWGSAGIAGVAGVAGIYLMSKLLASGEKPAVPPELQMAMMQKLGGGGATEAKGEDAADGRALTNMSKALGLIKLMQQMQAMGASQAVPDMARIA